MKHCASDWDIVLLAWDALPMNISSICGLKEGGLHRKLTSFFFRENLTAVMASGSGDSVTRRSVASQFFTQEEGPGIDGMTTSERVSE